VQTTELLAKYLDIGVDKDELRQIALAALARRLRELKLAVGDAVVHAQGEMLSSRPAGVEQALAQARRLQKEYHSLYCQWQDLYQREAHGTETDAGNYPAGGEE
jgi:hypothetical protein